MEVALMDSTSAAAAAEEEEVVEVVLVLRLTKQLAVLTAWG